MAQPSYTNATAVTPSNTATYSPALALYVGTAGNVAVTMAGGGQSQVVFTAVPAGTLLPVATIAVAATGTTAGSIIALR